MKLLDDLQLEYRPTGSNYICNPPVTDTDIDYICFHPQISLTTFLRKLEEEGPRTTTDCNYNDLMDLNSPPYKKGNINLIITHKRDFYENFVKATEEAKKLNLLDKADRIALFKKYLYGDENAKKPDTPV